MKREEGKKGKTRRRREEVREGKGGRDCRSLGMGEGTGGFILFVRSASRTTGKTECQEEVMWDTSDNMQSKKGSMFTFVSR